MTTNVPPEPDEFQTRMRPPEDVETTNRSGERPTAEQPQFAPPGLGGSSQPPQQPAQPQVPPGYGAPPQGYGQPVQPGYGQTPPQSGFGQASQPQQPSQQASTPFGQVSQPQQGYGYPQGGYGQPPQPGQSAPASAWSSAMQPQPPRDPSPIKAAFDLSFNAYATPGIVKIVYIVGIVLAALWYLFVVLAGFAAGAPIDLGLMQTEGTPMYGILAILFAWVPAAFGVLMLRILLEQVLSSVRTAADVRVLRERSDEDTTD